MDTCPNCKTELCERHQDVDFGDGLEITVEITYCPECRAIFDCGEH